MSIELFDKFGNYSPPTPEQIASLTPDQQQRFESVKLAAADRERAVAATKEAQARVVQCVADLRAAEAERLRISPPMSAVDAARAFMRANK